MVTAVTTMQKMYRAEYTDTWGPDRSANGSWQKTCKVVADSEKQAIRLIKQEFELTGIRCQKENYGDSLVLFPSGMARRVDVFFEREVLPLQDDLIAVLKMAEGVIDSAADRFPNPVGPVAVLREIQRVLKRAEE